MADIPLLEAVKMAKATPARILGVSDKKGSLTAGKDGDIMVFDDNIIIQTTMINGNIV